MNCNILEIEIEINLTVGTKYFTYIVTISRYLDTMVHDEDLRF